MSETNKYLTIMNKQKNGKALHLAVKLYEQAAAAQQAQAGAEGAQTADNSGDDVVDGEFTEK